MASLRTPFVVTVGSSALLGVACGGNVVVDPGGSGGAGTSTATTSSNATTGTGTAVVTSSSGTTMTTTGPMPECPPELPNGYTLCDVPESVVCTYDVSCQSGNVALSFQCTDETWQVLPQMCAQPYDSCPGTELYCSGQWLLPQGTNPPSPCPDTAPTAGATCFAGGFGGVWEQCGYPCDDSPNAPWTVATCTSTDPNTDGMWTYDGACE